MALRIPAAQVPFVREFFQIINNLAENANPNEDLVLERELFEPLTNDQLEGFRRLMDYYGTLPNNQRFARGEENSQRLLNYYKNPRPFEDLFVKFFGTKTDDEMAQLYESFQVLCRRISQMDLAPQELPLFFRFAHAMEEIGLLFGNLHLLDIQDVQELAPHLSVIMGDEPFTWDDCNDFGELVSQLCALDQEEREDVLLHFLSRIRTRNSLVQRTGLPSNNLKAMTNYLLFGANHGGGKRRRKTRKVGRR